MNRFLPQICKANADQFLRPAVLAGLLLLLSCVSPLRAQTEVPTQPPAEYAAMLKNAGLEFEFYDAKVDPQGHDGKARWDINLKSTYTYGYKWKTRGGRLVVTVTPKVKNSSQSVKHVVRLPKGYQTTDRWDKRLLRHEMDHVAVSTDPRIMLLYEELAEKMGPLSEEFPPGTTVTKTLAQEVIEKALEQRRQAVFKLINDNNRRLDTVTQHGTVAIADREAFFQSLYQKENLDALKFPYLSDLLELFDNPRYIAAESLAAERPTVGQ